MTVSGGFRSGVIYIVMCAMCCTCAIGEANVEYMCGSQYLVPTCGADCENCLHSKVCTLPEFAKVHYILWCAISMAWHAIRACASSLIYSMSGYSISRAPKNINTIEQTKLQDE